MDSRLDEGIREAVAKLVCNCRPVFHLSVPHVDYRNHSLCLIAAAVAFAPLHEDVFK